MNRKLLDRQENSVNQSRYLQFSPIAKCGRVDFRTPKLLRLGAAMILPLLLIMPARVDAIPPGYIQIEPAGILIEEVNALRMAEGLAAYRTSSILMVIAQEQADLIARTGVITHYGEDGSRPFQRAISAGYAVAGDLTFGGFFSENIIAGVGLKPAAVVEKWKANPTDLETMMSFDFQDIGVGYSVNHGSTVFVLDVGRADVSTLITGGTVSGESGSPAGTSRASPILTSTMQVDGAVYHIVQPDEALWSIALAYGISVEVIKDLNRLSSNDIQIGQKLMIVQPEDRWTETPVPTITVTLGIPISSTDISATPTMPPTLTQIPSPPTTSENGTITVFGIISIALFAAGLGVWLGKYKTESRHS